MKKFLRKSLLFILPVLVLLVASELLLRHIPNDYLYKSNYLNEHSDEIGTLFLGNSHVFFGVDPKYLEPNTFNGAHVSQSLDCDLGILKKYDGHWKKLKTIVLPVDYFSLFSTLGSGVEAWRVKNYNIYYGIGLSANPSQQFEIANGKFKENLGRIKRFYYLGQKQGDRHCTDLGWGTEYNSSQNHDLAESGKKAAERHTVADDKWFAENVKTLESIADFAQKRNIRLILITSPAYETYTKYIDKNQLQRTIDAITAVASKHKNTSYHNLLDDPRYVKEDFYDGDHFNEIGAKKFSMDFRQILDGISSKTTASPH